MQITYLKRQDRDRYKCFVKIIANGNNLVIDDDKIEAETFDNSYEDEINWYKKSWDMKDSTKQEFDAAYISIEGKLNELSKL